MMLVNKQAWTLKYWNTEGWNKSPFKWKDWKMSQVLLCIGVFSHIVILSLFLCKVSPLGRNNCMYQYMLGADLTERRKSLVSWWTTGWASIVPLWPRRPKASWDILGEKWNWWKDHFPDKELAEWSHLRELQSAAQYPSRDRWQVVFSVMRMVLFNNFVGNRDSGIKCTFNKMTQSDWCSWHIRGKGYHQEGPETDLKGRPTSTSWSSSRPSARSCTWGRAIPSTNRVENSLRTALRRRIWGC